MPQVFGSFVSQAGTIPEEVSDRRAYAGGARSADDKYSGLGPYDGAWSGGRPLRGL